MTTNRKFLFFLSVKWLQDHLLTETEITLTADGNVPTGSVTLHYQIDYYQYMPEENPAEMDDLQLVYDEITPLNDDMDTSIAGQIHLS